MRNVNSGLKQVDECEPLIDKYELKDVMDKLHEIEDSLEDLLLIPSWNKSEEMIKEILGDVDYVVSRLEEE